MTATVRRLCGQKAGTCFEEFVAEYGDTLLRLATLLISDQGLGEDVYQETLHRLAARWSHVDNPRAYCRRVMHNIVIDRARIQQRRPTEIRLAAAHDDGDPRSAYSALAVELRPVLLAAGATLESAWSSPSGEFDEDLYLKITYTKTIPSDPYHG